jgi:hypothetical protein
VASSDPTERALISAIASHERWSRTTTEERRQVGRDLASARLAAAERAVDPDGRMSPEDRLRAAEHHLHAIRLRGMAKARKVRQANAAARAEAVRRAALDRLAADVLDVEQGGAA